MSDDRKRQPGDPGDDSFSGALDDLFGPDEPEHNTVAPKSGNPNSNPAPQRQARQESYTAPISQANPEPGRQPQSEHNANPLPSYSQTQTTAPQQVAGRSIARVAGIGCAAIAGITVLCMAILLIIGLIAGEDTDTSGSTSPDLAVVTVESVAVGGLTGTGSANKANSSMSNVTPDVTRMVLDHYRFIDAPSRTNAF